MALEKLESPDGITTWRLKSASDLVVWVGKADEALSSSLWWRGQPSRFQLVPGVFRTPAGHRHESDLAARFRSRATTRYPKCPDWNDLAGWLFFMQHHGLLTRLLDWTESPLFGLYFAVTSGDEGNDGALYGLSPQALNDSSGLGQMILLPHHPQATELIKEAFRQSETRETTLAVFPPETDLRMLTQRAMFTIHGGPTPIESLNFAKAHVVRFLIPSERRVLIRRELRALGIERSTIFPDLTNLSAGLNEQVGALRTSEILAGLAQTSVPLDEPTT